MAESLPLPQRILEVPVKVDTTKQQTGEGFSRHLTYSRGTEIRSNKYRELDGMKLEGQYILEIPAGNANIENIKYFESIAEEYGVKLRFLEEVE